MYNLGVFNRVTIEPPNAMEAIPKRRRCSCRGSPSDHMPTRADSKFTNAWPAQRIHRREKSKPPPRGIFEISKQNVTGRATLSR